MNTSVFEDTDDTAYGPWAGMNTPVFEDTDDAAFDLSKIMDRLHRSPTR